jgi:subtilisin family serine protease
VGNTPPVLSFEENGPSVQGPLAMAVSRTAKRGAPLTLTAWVSDDAKFTTSSGARPKTMTAPVTLKWIKYRGPGTVTFSKDRPEVEPLTGTKAAFSGKGSTTVIFSEPGDYILHVTANDYSGEGGTGFQCCWTTGQVKVSVQP